MTGSSEREGTAPSALPSIDAFSGDPTRRISDWRSLWERDLAFPIRSHRGVAGKLLVLFKRLLRPFVTVPQNDLWERQRVFNLIVLEHLERIEDDRRHLDDLGRRVRHMEAFLKEGLDEVMRYNDALFTRVDQKLDRYRREARELSSHLQAALAQANESPPSRLTRAVQEETYVRFEERYRGTPEEIAARLEVYLPLLEGRVDVLDLGCGRGEALEVLGGAGHRARGVDSSSEMVRRCRERGLEAVEGDLLEVLAQQPRESLDAVVSFHVVEHLLGKEVDRLVQLAWRVLRPAGMLVLETPNPHSLLVGGSRFWLDPTHRRPVHPASLCHYLESAGFVDVERLDLNPFPEEERLPELDLAGLEAPELRDLADRLNRLRDRLDDLLFGFQDYAVVGRKQLASLAGG